VTDIGQSPTGCEVTFSDQTLGVYDLVGFETIFTSRDLAVAVLNHLFVMAQNLDLASQRDLAQPVCMVARLRCGVHGYRIAIASCAKQVCAASPTDALWPGDSYWLKRTPRTRRRAT
jgi:hypothetical protein